MVKGNDIIHKGHFHKKWKENVRTDFDQPARKARRRIKRIRMVLDNFLKPSGGLLRPVVRCPTSKYNIKIRKGKGFTVAELKAAGIPKKLAKTIGIAVDYRRRNKSVSKAETNVTRLRNYLSRLLITDRKPGNKKLDLKLMRGLTTDMDIVPLGVKTPHETARAITNEEKASSVLEPVGKARAEARARAIKRKATQKAKAEAVFVPQEPKPVRRGKAARKKKAAQTSEPQDEDDNVTAREHNI